MNSSIPSLYVGSVSSARIFQGYEVVCLLHSGRLRKRDGMAPDNARTVGYGVQGREILLTTELIQYIEAT